MSEDFTEAFVAVIFFHGSYRGSFHGIFFLKLPWKKNIIHYLLFTIYFHGSFRESSRGNKSTSTGASVKV